MSFTITNGVVEYERSTKPADYEKRAAKVVLAYNVAEGSDPQETMRRVFEMAVAEVHHRVGLDSPAYATPAGHNEDQVREAMQEKRDAAREAGFVTKAELANAVREAAKPAHSLFSPEHRAKVADREAAKVVPQENPTPAASTTSTGSETASSATAAHSPNPFAITAKAVPQVNPTATPTRAPSQESAATPTSAPSPTAATSTSADPVADGLTDNDLHAVAQQAIEKKVPAQTIRDITGKYAGQQGMTISQIPADKRQAWLDEVRKLYKP